MSFLKKYPKYSQLREKQIKAKAEGSLEIELVSDKFAIELKR